MAHLTLSKTKIIMKTAIGTDTISKDAIVATTRAAELFIKILAKEGYENTKPSKKFMYENLVGVIQNNSRYEFLEMIIPKKITVRQYKELMRKKHKISQGKTRSESSSTTEGSSDEEDESSEADSDTSNHKDNIKTEKS